MDLSRVFLRELRKAVAAGMKNKDLAASKAIAMSSSALERHSGVGGEAWTSRNSSQLHVNRRKGEEISSSDCPSEPASRCPEPAHLFGDGPAALGTTDELAAESSRQLGSTEGGLAHAEVVAGCTGTQQPSGPHKPSAKGSDHTELAASSEVATGRMSVGDMSGPLCGMPDGTT
jgi:hypothetical protein